MDSGCSGSRWTPNFAVRFLWHPLLKWRLLLIRVHKSWHTKENLSVREVGSPNSLRTRMCLVDVERWACGPLNTTCFLVFGSSVPFCHLLTGAKVILTSGGALSCLPCSANSCHLRSPKNLQRGREKGLVSSPFLVESLGAASANHVSAFKNELLGMIE